MKINPQIYLKAAKLQYHSFWYYGHEAKDMDVIKQLEGIALNAKSSRFSCDNVNQAAGRFENYPNIKPGLEKYQELYKEYFKPPQYNFGWWEMNSFGNECRILALLLMYEIAKDLYKPKKKLAKKKRKG